MNDIETQQNIQARNTISTFAICSYIMLLPIIALRWNQFANVVFVLVWIIVLFDHKFVVVIDETCNIWIGSFLLWMLLTTFLATNKEVAWRGNLVMIRCAFIPWLIVTECDSFGKLRKFFYSFVIGTFILVGLIILEYSWNGILEQMNEGLRVGGEVSNENSIGRNCAISIIFLFYFLIFEKKKNVILLMVPLVIMLFASASRTATIMASVGLIICYLLNSKGERIRKILLLFLICLPIYIIISKIPAFKVIFNRMDEFFALFRDSKDADASTEIRLKLIKFGFEMFLKQPITGYGTGQFNILFSEYYGVNFSPHNAYIQALVSYGIVGFSLWFGMYIYFIIRLFPRRNELSSMNCLIISIVIAWLIGDSFSHSMMEKSTFLLLGFGFAAIKICESNTDISIERQKDYNDKKYLL